MFDSFMLGAICMVVGMAVGALAVVVLASINESRDEKPQQRVLVTDGRDGALLEAEILEQAGGWVKVRFIDRDFYYPRWYPRGVIIATITREASDAAT